MFCLLVENRNGIDSMNRIIRSRSKKKVEKNAALCDIPETLRFVDQSLMTECPLIASLPDSLSAASYLGDSRPVYSRQGGVVARGLVRQPKVSPYVWLSTKTGLEDMGGCNFRRHILSLIAILIGRFWWPEDAPPSSLYR